MVASVTHATVVVVADDGTSPVGTNEWNAAHTVTGVIESATKDQSFTGGVRTLCQSLSTGNVTIDPGDGPLQYITNGGAFTLTAPANDGSCIVLVTNNGSAGTITFSGFTMGPSVGDTLTTTNTHQFSISIWCVNGISGYRVAAHQDAGLSTAGSPIGLLLALTKAA